ncbi:MAG TPA: PocR ligand-binding domain-containing protein [Candidatus Coprocola pullicola]|nr:PocR ligand-binding domain-containing protein [Candidatus Coprocola pullicola]
MEEKTLQKSLDTTLLQQIQDLLATATDLAYNIVDYKGCPINKFSNFSAFCTTIRSCKEGMEICSDINARSGFEAALRGKPFLFQCPGGLIDLAVPIIINGNFWGAVCFGQVRTDKKEIPLLKSDKNTEKVFEKFPILKTYYKQTQTIPYERLKAIGDLVFVLINQLIERFSLEVLEEKLSLQDILLRRQAEKIQYLEKEIEVAHIKEYQMQIDIVSVYHGFNLLSKLAFLEEAENTQEMTYILIEYYKKIAARKAITTIKEEIELLKDYQKIVQKRFGDRIKWKIEIDEMIEKIKFPANVVSLCVQYCVLYGLCPKAQGGTVTVKGESMVEKYHISFCHDGIALKQKTIFDIIKCEKESETLFDGFLYKAIKIVKSVYQKNCNIKLESTEEKTVITFEIISL